MTDVDEYAHEAASAFLILYDEEGTCPSLLAVARKMGYSSAGAIHAYMKRAVELGLLAYAPDQRPAYRPPEVRSRPWYITELERLQERVATLESQSGQHES